MTAQNAQAAPTMNPMDDMRARERMMQARMEGMQEIMPTAEQLYNTMSPKQKGMWDDVVISYKVGGCHLLCRAGLE